MSGWDKAKGFMGLTALGGAAGYAITRPGATEAIGETYALIGKEATGLISSTANYITSKVSDILTYTDTGKAFAGTLAPWAIPAMGAYFGYKCKIGSLLKDSYGLGKGGEIALNCLGAGIGGTIGIVGSLPAYLPISTMIGAGFLAYKTAKLGKWGLKKAGLIRPRTP
ncbi:hypothetical protein BKN14_01500 [Candidatus Gracilibacteria bacterium HOT-871]|nr:hypothetical protein BKN14_01500 [Candidatus Gracilibacteria bacterium HOT-871]MBB1565235.1 hypothetical protein [Candidatus Gracilibacteria bacterium]RKW23647.1 MAG: hypothetical protein D8B46_02920 [Candidatus Gracilibacteria bacterium]